MPSLMGECSLRRSRKTNHFRQFASLYKTTKSKEIPFCFFKSLKLVPFVENII